MADAPAVAVASKVASKAAAAGEPASGSGSGRDSDADSEGLEQYLLLVLGGLERCAAAACREALRSSGHRCKCVPV